MTLLRTATSLINGAGAAVRALGVEIGRLTPDDLEHAASHSEGHNEFSRWAWGREGVARPAAPEQERPHFREGLEMLVESLEGDANLHTAGRLHMRALLIELLVTRLRLAAMQARTPTTRAALMPPLFVCGLPRSGTTFLHRMLAERGDARPLPLWELREPIRGPGRDRRLEQARVRDQRLAAILPDGVDAQHLMRAELPDECGHLFKITFWSSLFWQVPVYRYLEWYLAHDSRQPYREYFTLLDALARPGRRFVLKDPFHAANLPSLFAVVPEAMVVHTHRDPLEVVPSFHKLTTTFQAVLSDRVDRARTIALNLRWLQSLVTASEACRARIPAQRVFDVDYADLLANPLAVVEATHAHFGLDLDDAYRRRLQRFIADNPQRKHGQNPYATADFGQQQAEIAEAFAPYRERFRR